MKLSELIENLICLEELEKEKKRENGAPTSKAFKDYTVYIALKNYELYNKDGSIGVYRFNEPDPKASVLRDRYGLVDFGFIDDLEAPKESVKVGEVHTLELRTDGKSTKIKDITIDNPLKGASIKKEVFMPLAPPTREEYVLCRCKECGYEYSIRQDRVNGKWKGVCQFCEKKQKETSPQELMQKAQEVVEEAKKHDVVNHPKHYTQGGIECIDALESATINKRGIEAVCTANIIKYLWRYESKNGIEDVKKAQWYLDRLIKELEK